MKKKLRKLDKKNKRKTEIAHVTFFLEIIQRAQIIFISDAISNFKRAFKFKFKFLNIN